MVYDNEDPQEILRINNLSQADLDNLNRFNTETCADIPIFRLGYSKNGNGFYVQGNVDVSKSSVYNSDKANLLAITPEKARQFTALVEKILSSIEDRDLYSEFTIGAKLLKPDKKTPWDAEELIDLTEAAHRRTLSGLISDVNDKFVLQTEDQILAYPSDAAWSLIPAYLSNLVRTITRMQHHENSSSNTVKNALLIIPNEDGSKEKQFTLATQIDDLFSDGHLQYGNDSSLLDMLDLVFHGTVADIHAALRSGEQLLQLDDAYFKQGFFVNPDVSRVLNKEGKYETININDDNGDVLFYQIATSPELFTVDTDVRTSGIGIRLDKLINKMSEEKQYEHDVVEIPEETFKQKYPTLTTIIDTVNTDLIVQGMIPFEYELKDLTDIESLYNDKVKANLEAYFNNQNLDILNEPLYVTISSEGDVVSHYVRDYIATQLGSHDFETKFDNESLIIKYKGKTYQTDVTFKLQELQSFEIVEMPDVVEEVAISQTSKYDTKLSDSGIFRKAFPKLLLDETIRTQLKIEANNWGNEIEDGDIDQLYNILINLFDSDKQDSDIDEQLITLENNVTYNAFTSIISSEFFDILNKCYYGM